MKTTKLLTGLFFVFGVTVLLNAAPAFSEEAKGRDWAVDTALVNNSRMGGVLPATAGQAVPASGLFGGAQQPFLDPARPDKFPDPALMVNDKADKKGRVFEIKGNVKYTKKGSSEWKSLSNQTWIEEGDSILTEKGGHVSVTFDARYLNVTHIPENTRVIFRAIEPLDLFVEDGTVFNLFDALPVNNQWKVSTPTAVAAVRGTYFVMHFTASDGTVFTATFNVPDDGHASKVELTKLTPGGNDSTVEIPEGKEIDLKEGQTLDASLLGEIDQKWIDEIEDLLKLIQDFRQNHGGQLPATSGEFFEPNTFDPQGTNTVGGGLDNHDIDLRDHELLDRPAPEEPESEERGEQLPPFNENQNT